jgi:hypothetical protein
MPRIDLSRRRWPAALLLAVAALAIGAIFGSFRESSAAIAATPPTNQSAPVISGTAQEGQTLTSSTGTWTGDNPITFTYQWSRCDANGKNCATISGATTNTYLVTKTDVGNTLQVVVVGTNASGKDSEGSLVTAVVTAAAASTGCPTGNGTIQIADLSLPSGQLQISSFSSNPNVITKSSTTIQLSFTITACGGRPVQGALVYATAVPYNQYSIEPEPMTDANGTAVLTMHQLTGFPASSKQAQLTVFARARKSGENLLGGISARRLVAFNVNLRG